MHDVEDLRLQRQQREAAAPAAAVAPPGAPTLLQQQAGAASLAGEEVWGTPPSTPLRATAPEEQLPAPSGGLPAAERKPCGPVGMADGTVDGSEAAGRGLRRTCIVVGPVATERLSGERLQAQVSGSAPRTSLSETPPAQDAGALAGSRVGAAPEAPALSPLSRLSTPAAAPQRQAAVPSEAAAAAAEADNSRAAAAAEADSSRAAAVGAAGNPKRQERPAMCACSSKCSSPSGAPEQPGLAAGRTRAPDGGSRAMSSASAAGPETLLPVGLRPGLLSNGKWSPLQPASSHDSPADSQAASRVASGQWQVQASLGTKPELGLRLAPEHRPPVPPGAHVYVFVHGFQVRQCWLPAVLENAQMLTCAAKGARILMRQCWLLASR